MTRNSNHSGAVDNSTTLTTAPTSGTSLMTTQAAHHSTSPWKASAIRFCRLTSAQVTITHRPRTRLMASRPALPSSPDRAARMATARATRQRIASGLSTESGARSNTTSPAVTRTRCRNCQMVATDLPLVPWAGRPHPRWPSARVVPATCTQSSPFAPPAPIGVTGCPLLGRPGRALPGRGATACRPANGRRHPRN
ncbi:Uncharacterised protein [Mycobacteroides abscessus subsp. abscessus]|nr:Uncharacterised protein [Mycobacteroides abscessus subsp. abscessus]